MFTAIESAFDLPILEWVTGLQCKFMDIAMKIVSIFGEFGIFWIVVALIMLFFKKTRKTGLMLGIAFILGLAIGNGILKPWIARPRPYETYPEVLQKCLPNGMITNQMWDYSFPSGHSLVCFEAVGVLIFQYRKKIWGWLALALGILMMLSRMYLFLHYPTDVLAGAVLGFLFGVIGYLTLPLIWDAIEKMVRKKKAAKEQTTDNETN